jgi:hypothetical protein
VSTERATCTCGNQDLWVTAAIPVNIRVNPSGVSLHITRPGTHPDFQPWETAECPRCGATDTNAHNDGLSEAIEHALAALTRVTAVVRCEDP